MEEFLRAMVVCIDLQDRGGPEADATHMEICHSFAILQQVLDKAFLLVGYAMIPEPCC